MYFTEHLLEHYNLNIKASQSTYMYELHHIINFITIPQLEEYLELHAYMKNAYEPSDITGPPDGRLSWFL